MRLRFKSILNPERVGYEFTGDSMTFWESAYRNGGTLSGAFGCYETYGDGEVQHSQLRSCGVSEFTDFCVSLTQHLSEHLNELVTDWSSHAFGFCQAPKETALFLSTVVFKESKPQWFNISERKLTTNRNKQFDKRWQAVPSWADGTIASAYSLWGLERNSTNYLFELYSRQYFFADVLYGVVPEGYEQWERITKWHQDIPGDHRQAFIALKGMVHGLEQISYAVRASKSAVYNSRPKTESEIAA